MLKVTGLSVPVAGTMSGQVEFHLEQGDFFVLFGSEKSGKTEVLNAVMGLAKSCGGTVEFAGKNIAALSIDERKKIRFVPEKSLMLQGVKLKNYLNSLAMIYKLADKALINELVEYFELDEKEYLTKMTPERNKLASIIGALITSPELLILDEPFRSLSEEMSERLLNCLRKRCDEGMTLLVATEHFEDADERANSYLYLRKGEPVKEGRIPADWIPQKKLVIRKADPERIKEAFGEPEATCRDALIYIRDISWEEIGKCVSACGIEKNTVVRTARLGEILDVEYQPKEEAEPEEPKRKKNCWRWKKENKPAVMEEELALASEENGEPVRQETDAPGEIEEVLEEMPEETEEVPEETEAMPEEILVISEENRENEESPEDEENREDREETADTEGGQEA